MSTCDVDGVYPPYNFSWIVKDELAGMGCPKTAANLRYLESEGIKHLITLSPEMRPQTRDVSELEWLEIPIEEFCSPTLKQMKKFIDICETSKSRSEAVGIHCRMGRGRTGVMAACFLVRFYDQSPGRAITNIRLMRPGSVETYEQENAVKEYYDYLRSI